MKYGVGVGREGFTWSGVTTVSAKREWPDWTPPPEMLRRRPDLPRHMAGGLDNLRNPAQRGHRFQRKADSIPVIADSR
jgi:lipoprotein-anchoring transpeptidase ErfK/SrfK